MERTKGTKVEKQKSRRLELAKRKQRAKQRGG